VALWPWGFKSPLRHHKTASPGQADLLKCDVEPSRAAHRDLHVIWVHGDGLQQLLYEGRRARGRWPRPRVARRPFLEDAGHLLEPGGQV